MWAGMTGVVFDFAGSAPPNGWLLCYGQAVSRTTYAALFNKIGTTYGAGDGSTTFNLPDCRGRVTAGVDNMGGAAANRMTSGGSGVNGSALGAAGGAETHVLTTAQMPAHNHGVTDPGHAHTLQTRLGTSTSGMTHFMQGSADNSTLTTPNGAILNTTGISIQNNGSGNAHNNAQPTIVLNKIIKI